MTATRCCPGSHDCCCSGTAVAQPSNTQEPAVVKHSLSAHHPRTHPLHQSHKDTERTPDTLGNSGQGSKQPTARHTCPVAPSNTPPCVLHDQPAARASPATDLCLPDTHQQHPTSCVDFQDEINPGDNRQLQLPSRKAPDTQTREGLTPPQQLTQPKSCRSCGSSLHWPAALAPRCRCAGAAAVQCCVAAKQLLSPGQP